MERTAALGKDCQLKHDHRPSLCSASACVERISAINGSLNLFENSGLRHSRILM
jgi:hypothetical protein